MNKGIQQQMGNIHGRLDLQWLTVLTSLSRRRKIPHMSGVPPLLQTENWINTDWTRSILRALLFCPVRYFCSMQFYLPHLTFTCCGCPIRSCQTTAVCHLPCCLSHCLSHSKLHRISVRSPDLWLSFAPILEPNNRYQVSTCWGTNCNYVQEHQLYSGP